MENPFKSLKKKNHQGHEGLIVFPKLYMSTHTHALKKPPYLPSETLNPHNVSWRGYKENVGQDVEIGIASER